MHRLVAAVALALLSLAPSAHAKGIAAAEVCGTVGCAPLREQAGYGVVQGGGVSGPGSAQPFVEVNVTFRADAPPGGKPATDELIFQFAPKAGMVRNEKGLWHRPDAATVGALREASAKLQWFPAAKLTELAPELAPPPPAEPAPARAADDSSSPWTGIAIAGVAALAAAALVVTVRRRHAVPAR